MAWRTENAKILIEKGAELSIKDEDGKTPLALASDTGQTDIVLLLRKKGAL